MSVAIVAVICFLLFALAGTLIGIDYFRERNAELERRINDGLTPFDPEWAITEGDW